MALEVLLLARIRERINELRARITATSITRQMQQAQERFSGPPPEADPTKKGLKAKLPARKAKR